MSLLFAILWTAACQASLSFTNSQSLFKLMSIESVMPSNHLVLCHPLLLPPSIFPSLRGFSSESVLRIRWPKYWSFSISISPSNEYLGLISFRIDLGEAGTIPSSHWVSSLPLGNIKVSAFLALSSTAWLRVNLICTVLGCGDIKAGKIESLHQAGRQRSRGQRTALGTRYRVDTGVLRAQGLRAGLCSRRRVVNL